MKGIGRGLGYFFVLALTFWVLLYHVGTFLPPNVPLIVGGIGDEPTGAWVSREEVGINQLVLTGPPYARGLEEGRLTEKLLFEQESELTTRLFRIVPRWLFVALEPLGILYFSGIERYFEPWMTQEMYGVSKSAPHEFDYLGDGYTRQIAYHGVHEIGQMMVDQKGDAMGCTVAAVPTKKSWIVGRNFDFEGGRIFDREKVMKWVFPDNGNAFVSIIWAGMVGAVTGVNEKGIYISLNAAGTKDYRRIGTPSTLVLLKVLQFANTGDEALKILRSETMFITDVFVLFDSKAGLLYRIEKSPHSMDVFPLTRPSIVTNYLQGPRFADDPTNLFRRFDLTSEARQVRGEALLAAAFPHGKLATKASEVTILSILRDKGEFNGKRLTLGNRNAIDPLIATHSVIFNGSDQTLYVSKGPGVSGEFLGYNLRASFQGRRPTRRGRLPADPLVTPERFANVHALEETTSAAEHELRRSRCDSAAELLRAAGTLTEKIGEQTYEYETAVGDLEACLGNLETARAHWERALSLQPAYRSERTALEEKLHFRTSE